MRGRERLAGRELLALHRGFERVVVAIGAAPFLERDPPQHRLVGNRVVHAARPRRREHFARACARATGSSTRGSGRRCARRAHRCRPRRRSRSQRSAARAAAPTTDFGRLARELVARGLGARARRDAARAVGAVERVAQHLRPVVAGDVGLAEHLLRASGGPCGAGPSRAARSGRPGPGAWPASAAPASSGSIALARRVRHSSALDAARRAGAADGLVAAAVAGGRRSRRGRRAGGRRASRRRPARSRPRSRRRSPARVRHEPDVLAVATPLDRRRRRRRRRRAGSPSVAVDVDARRSGGSPSSFSISAAISAATSIGSLIRRRSLDRGARLDLRERFGRVEERALDGAVRVEQIGRARRATLRSARSGARAGARDRRARARAPTSPRRASRGLDGARCSRIASASALADVERSTAARASAARDELRGSAPRLPPCATRAGRRPRARVRSAAAARLLDQPRRRAPRPSCGCRRWPRARNAAAGRSPRPARRAAPAPTAAAGVRSCSSSASIAASSSCSWPRAAASSSATRFRNARTSVSLKPRTPFANDAVRDLVGRQTRRARDHSLPPVGLVHRNPHTPEREGCRVSACAPC